MTYENYFERNFGIYTNEEQERIRTGQVTIIGSGGIGGLIAIVLARSGLENFRLYEFDTYQPANMNRQITCFTDTLGMNKAVSVAETISRINPQAQVEVHPKAVQPDEVEEIITQSDLLIPAADDWAMSIYMMDKAKDMGKTTILAYPVGALARVCTFKPDGPYASECLVMPYKSTYQELDIFMNDPHNRSILQYYLTQGAWRQDWFEGFCCGEKTHAQLCTTVWITGSLAAQEALNFFSKKWKPTAAPRYWHITPMGGKIARFSYGRRLMSRISSKPWGRKMIPWMAKRPRLVKTFTRLIS